MSTDRFFDLSIGFMFGAAVATFGLTWFVQSEFLPALDKALYVRLEGCAGAADGGGEAAPGGRASAPPLGNTGGTLVTGAQR
ncbi:MAG: hypothetical protein V4532_19340 [Pseudomonadota bacterium]